MSRRRKLKWFWVILLTLVGEGMISAPEAQMDFGMPIPEAVSIPKFYSEADFYYLEKDGRRTPLVLYSKALVVKFKPEVSEPAQWQEFFSRMGWNMQDISVEKLKVVVGAEEAKRSLTVPLEVFIITFTSPQKIVFLLNQAVDDPVVWYAAPVFWRKDDLVFPAGVWFRVKYFDQGEPENLWQSIREQGYERLTISPDVVSPRLRYYYKDSVPKKGINPLQLSRFVAQSVWILWSVPDFVSIKPHIQIVADLSRPSGVMGQTLTAHYRIRYNSGKIAVNTDDLQKIDAARLRPSKVGNGLFRVDPVSLDSRTGEILLKISFQVYQPGDFSLPGLKVFYAFSGARKDLPPEETITPDLPFKVVGFVPRDDKGKPTVPDIFGWKKEKNFSAPEVLVKPVSESYPATDLRFWTKSLHKKYPGLRVWLRQASFIFWAAALVFIIGPAFRMAVKKARAYRENPYGIFVRAIESAGKFMKENILGQDHSFYILQTGRTALRSMVGLSEGKTDREVLESASPSIKFLVEKLLLLLNPDNYKRGFLDWDEVAVIEKNMLALKRIMRWRKMFGFWGSLWAKILSKVRFWQEL